MNKLKHYKPAGRAARRSARGKIAKSAPYGRVIQRIPYTAKRIVHEDGSIERERRVRYLHATKGWRDVAA